MLETALAIVIIGSGIVAVLQLLAAGTLANEAASDLTTAVNLANNIHEVTIRLPLIDPNYPGTWNPHLSNAASFGGVSEFDGSTFSPPIDVSCQPIAGYSNWSQVVTVKSVSHTNLNNVIANTTSEWTAPSPFRSCVAGESSIRRAGWPRSRRRDLARIGVTGPGTPWECFDREEP